MRGARDAPWIKSGGIGSGPVAYADPPLGTTESIPETQLHPRPAPRAVKLRPPPGRLIQEHDDVSGHYARRRTGPVKGEGRGGGHQDLGRGGRGPYAAALRSTSVSSHRSAPHRTALELTSPEQSRRRGGGWGEGEGGRAVRRGGGEEGESDAVDRGTQIMTPSSFIRVVRSGWRVFGSCPGDGEPHRPAPPRPASPRPAAPHTSVPCLPWRGVAWRGLAFASKELVSRQQGSPLRDHSTIT